MKPPIFTEAFHRATCCWTPSGEVHTRACWLAAAPPTPRPPAQVYVRRRPHLEAFLQAVSKHFEIVVRAPRAITHSSSPVQSVARPNLQRGSIY